MKCVLALMLFVGLLLVGGIAFAQDGVTTIPDTPVATVVAVTATDAPIVATPVVVESAPAPQLASTGTDWQTLIIGFLITLISIDRITGSFFSRKAIDVASRFIDPAVAYQIFNAGYEAGLKRQLNAAAKTESPDDDEFWIKQAEAAGYKVVKVDSGYELQAAQTPAAPPVG